MNEEKIKQDLLEFEGFLKQKVHDANSIQNYLKKTSLPFIPCYMEELTAKQRFDLSFEYLHLLGIYNLPLSVGLCMNQYIALSISCIPAEKDSSLALIKEQFLRQVQENRWVLAVSSFDDHIRNKTETAIGVNCTSQQNGTILCNGIKNFQSNLMGSDLLLFPGILDGKSLGFFYLFIHNTPGLKLGKPSFSGAMADADTRSIQFDNVTLPSSQMFPLGDSDGGLIHGITRVIFAALAMAPYLGGAKRALDEAVLFVHSVHEEGNSLASLDGTQVDFGRMALEYENSMQLIQRFSQDLGSNQDLMSWLKSEELKALALKYHVTSICEKIVDFSRKAIGTRSMSSHSIISKLNEQIRFGTMHPEINAKIERRFGRHVLCEVTEEK